MNPYIDSLLAEWWQHNEKISNMGYPSDYTLDRIASLQPAKSQEFVVDIPRRLVPIDRAMREIRRGLWIAMFVRACIPGKDEEKCQRIGLPLGTYRAALDKGHEFIDGYMRGYREKS